MSQRNSFTRTGCGCSIERLIHREDAYIFITGAQKQSDSPSGKSYIAYHIRIGVSFFFFLYIKKLFICH
jgi:sorting nexin-4